MAKLQYTEERYPITIIWNGDIKGRERFNSYFKVSESIPLRINDLVGGIITKSNSKECVIESIEEIDDGKAYFTITSPSSGCAVVIIRKEWHGMSPGTYFQYNTRTDIYVNYLNYMRSRIRFD